MRVLMMLLSILSLNTFAQKPTFEKATFAHDGGVLPYRILKPVEFDESKKYPLHIFLHGSGERGNDNEAQLIHGSDRFIKESTSHPAIVIFPQCPAEDYWAQIASFSRDETSNENIFTYPQVSKPGWAMSAVMALLDNMLSQPYVDAGQVHLGGLSMGAMGAFELLARRPDTFASAVAICGGTNIANVSKWAGITPIWIFHGDDDPVVPSYYSKAVVEALIKEEAPPKFSLYPGVGHDSWTKAFAEPDLFDWIYSHQKEMAPECTPEWLKFTEATLLGKYRDANALLKQEDNTQKIVFMGDSITEGWLEASPAFWKKHPEFINRGFSGHTTSQMLVRFRQDVIDLKPKAVVILAGTNDIAGNTGMTSLPTIASNIFAMADMARAHGIEVIIASVLPAYDYPWKPGLAPAQKIMDLNEELSAFAKANNHAYLDYHTAMKDERNGLKEAYTYDMVHCTPEGYKKMEEVLLKSLVR